MADGRTPRHVRRPKKAARRKASSELVTGRAVVVFWPMKPSFKLWRLAWVH